MNDLSLHDIEMIKVVAIVSCPILLSICAWFIRAKLSEDAIMKQMVISIDKKLAVMTRDVECLVHENKIVWQRIEDMRDRFLKII